MKNPARPLPFWEFIVLIALLMATSAYSTDAMLPLLGAIGSDLVPQAPERAQLVLTIYLLGLGVGTFIAGPLSDIMGRKTVMLGGIALYMTAAIFGAMAGSMSALLMARFVHGFGAAAPRVVSQALVRDLYAGRMMARVVSFSFMVFTLVPAIAPLMGAGLGALFGWRAIFWSFVGFGAISGLWLALRQPETLPRDSRRPLNAAALWAALREVVTHPRVRLYLLAQTFVFAALFIWLSEVGSIFDQSFDRAASFPRWFALVAVLAAPASMINARLVMTLGMRRMISVALVGQIAMSLTVLIYFASQTATGGFWLFLAFMITQFFSMGLLIGNINALALEPMGHIAGMASSVLGGIATFAAALLAIPMALVHDGTPVPLAAAALLCAVFCATCMARANRYD